MHFSFLTYQFARYPLEHSFIMAREYGFEGVEVWGGRPHAYGWDMDAERMKEILAWKKQYGVAISMYTPEILAYPYNLVSADKKEREETVAYLKRCLEVAAAMGTNRMQITIKHPGYGRDRSQIWELLQAGLIKLCEKAQTEQVKIILESLTPSEGNVITCVDDIVQIQRQIQSPCLCSMIDMVPPFIANEPYAEYFDKLKNTMDYVHICNSDGKTEFHAQLNDREGMIPLGGFFRILKRYQYTGWCSLELLAPYFRDPELYLSEASGVIRSICTELQIDRQKRS